MDSQKDRVTVELESASRLNQSLAKRVRRWKRLRLGMATVLLVVGVGAVLLKTASVFAVPCFIGAFVVYLLYLEARDHLREVESRQWVSATPRISKLREARPARAPDAPSPH